MHARSEARAGSTPHWDLSPSSDADVWQDVVRAFETAIDTPTDEAMWALRTAATEAAGCMREAEVAPERAVIALKAVLARHGGGGWTPSLDADRETRREASQVYSKLFAWFVDGYYEGSTMLASGH